MISNALQGLCEHRQFIVYRSAPSKTRLGKTDKIPCDYRTGKPASAGVASGTVERAPVQRRPKGGPGAKAI